ncbi:MAG: hypothetical protein IKZ96_00990 [Bacilli bacterium]|nr:hypothetical protein [Bacilli bacterium]
MKIFTENAVYVQRKDIDYISNELSIILPASIITKTYGDGIQLIDSSHSREFIRFTEPEEIEYFRNEDIILDYNEVKGLTVKGLNLLINQTSIEIGNILCEAKALLTDHRLDFEDDEEDDDFTSSIDKIDLEVDKVSHRLKSLIEFKNYKRRKTKLELPVEVIKTHPSFIKGLLPRKRKNPNNN